MSLYEILERLRIVDEWSPETDVAVLMSVENEMGTCRRYQPGKNGKVVSFFFYGRIADERYPAEYFVNSVVIEYEDRADVYYWSGSRYEKNRSIPRKHFERQREE